MKYHKKHNNTIYQILNACFDPWPISADEKEVIITKAKVIFKETINYISYKFYFFFLLRNS